MRTLTKTIRETFVQDCCYRWELCGGLGVRILGSYFCGLGSVSGQGTEIPKVTRRSQKSKASCNRYERLNSSLNTNKGKRASRKFTAKEQSERVSGWKITKRRIVGRGILANDRPGT